MSVYTVLDCRFKKTIDVNTPEGSKPFCIYMLELDKGDGIINAEWKTLPSSPEPQKGSQVEGTLENSTYGWIFKKAARSRAGDGGGSRREEPFRKHPAEVAAVQRAHAQEMAVRQMDLRQRSGELDNTTSQNREALLKKLIDWFEQDVANAMKRAELGDQAIRLADAGEKALQSHVEAPVSPREGDPSMETHEEMEERIRAEVIRDNTLRTMP